MSDAVLVETRDNVLVMTISRPEARNAINSAVASGLAAALDRLDEEPALSVGVLTGGPTVFSAGTDLIAGAGEPTERGGNYGVVRRRRGKPLIAAVEGLALGGGMEIALACDLVVAGRGAAFGLPEVARGVVATCAGLFRGPRALPLNVARELLLTGDRNRVFTDSNIHLHKILEKAAPGRHELASLPGYGHLDPLIGKDSHIDVFPRVVDFLKRHAS